jgi:copper(I)-binding protein
MKPFFAVLTALMLSTIAALAHGVTAGKLEIIHPNIPQPIPSAKSAAGYMGIYNDGDTADRLIGVETGIAQSSMLHTTEHSADGVARMIHVEGLDIPAGETIVLEPDGMHVMLMGLTGPMLEGDMVPATLIFEHAGRVEMEFMVDPPGGVDHSTMDHGPIGAAIGADADAPAQMEAVLKAQFDRPEVGLVCP